MAGKEFSDLGVCASLPLLFRQMQSQAPHLQGLINGKLNMVNTVNISLALHTVKSKTIFCQFEVIRVCSCEA